jgi:hypothetical protein
MSDTTASAVDYEALKTEISEAQEKVRTLVKGILPAIMKDFFTRHPDVHGIGWVQYAPYFNDGEACTFSRHEVSIWLTEDSLEENGWHEGDQYGLKGEQRKDFDKIVDVVEEIDEHFLEDLYGDGVSVLFTKNGVEVSSHSHD